MKKTIIEPSGILNMMRWLSNKRSRQRDKEYAIDRDTLALKFYHTSESRG